MGVLGQGEISSSLTRVLTLTRHPWLTLTLTPISLIIHRCWQGDKILALALTLSPEGCDLRVTYEYDHLLKSIQNNMQVDALYMYNKQFHYLHVISSLSPVLVPTGEVVDRAVVITLHTVFLMICFSQVVSNFVLILGLVLEVYCLFGSYCSTW